MNPEPDKNEGWEWIPVHTILDRSDAELMPGMKPAVRNILRFQEIPVMAPVTMQEHIRERQL